MECPKCQTNNPNESKFCMECATPLPGIREAEHTKTLETPKEDLTRGSTFAGRYEIIEELGKGGMGRVYRVEDKKIKQEIALKLIKPDIASDKKTIERFKNELTTARTIRHKNVCAMFDLGEEKGQHYITMEYISGEDLKGSIRRFGHLPIGKSISIAGQICEGLAEAHNLGVVHRDLKPNNIMIDKDGNARIMDFGIARSIREKGITGSGIMIGTPEYMSPEQVEAKDVDQRSDIYSLGVVLYEMTTGRLPFEGDTPFAIGIKHKSEAPKDPKEFNPQIPDDLSAVILKCLEKEKGKRYQNIGEVKSELEKIEKGLPTTDRVIPKKKPLTSKEMTVTFNFKKLSLPVLAFLVIVVVFIAVFLGRSPKLDPDRVVVASFINQTGDPNLDFVGRRAAEMISQGLKTIVAVEVAPIAEFDLGQEKNVEEKHLRRLAKNNKAALVISGEYYPQGENLAFHANIYNAIEQKLSPSPEPISGQKENPIEALEKLRSNLMSVVLRLLDPRMEIWLTLATYTPTYEALVEFIKGFEFFVRGKYEDSIEYFDRAAEIDPNYLLPLYMAAIAHINSAGSFSVAAQYLERIKQIPTLSQGERTMQDWLDAWLKGDYESMFRITQQHEARVPGTAQSYELGLEAIITNRPHVAVEALARLDPEGEHMKDWIGYWSVLTQAHHMIGNHKQELKEALKAQEQYPESWSPLSYKIQALSALGRLDKVYKVLEESYAKPLTDYWNSARLMVSAGAEFKAHGYDDAAAEMFEQALSWLRQKSPEEQSDYMKYQLALAYAYSQNWGEARTLFKELHELYPESLTYLGNLGLLAARTGDREEALRIFELLKNWDKPYIFGSHTFWQAVIAAALDEKERATTLLRDALSQGQRHSNLYCIMSLEPLWDYPAFIELLKPRE